MFVLESITYFDLRCLDINIDIYGKFGSTYAN